ncbi:MAG TPA: hypothetical protein VLJ37_10805 [bacterium]|nr:hypothetical protein [bacterium]
MDQQKQPTPPGTKTGAEVKPSQPQQQKGNSPQEQGIKQASPTSGNQPPLPKEATAPTGAAPKAL